MVDDKAHWVFEGPVTRFEASGGSEKSHLFMFNILDAKSGETEFQLRDDTPPDMFAAMATIVATAFCAHPPVPLQVTTYDRQPNGIYLVNLIRGLQKTSQSRAPKITRA